MLDLSDRAESRLFTRYLVDELNRKTTEVLIGLGAVTAARCECIVSYREFRHVTKRAGPEFDVTKTARFDVNFYKTICCGDDDYSIALAMAHRLDIS